MGLLKLSSIYKSRKSTKGSTTSPSVPLDHSPAPKLEPLKLSLDFESSSTPVFNTTTTTSTSNAPVVSSSQQHPSTTTTNITTTTNVSTATVPAGSGGTLFDDILSELNSPKPAANQQSGKANDCLFMGWHMRFIK